MRPVMGIENEYGIAAVGDCELDEMGLSNAVVRAWRSLLAAEGSAGNRWDYTTETPLQDSRGFQVERARAHPTQLTDDETMANVVLPNGARFYVDHAHPEYSGPECTSARDTVLHDAAGDLIARRAAEEAGRRMGVPIRLWKNNTDGKGASYGTHENYLTPRDVNFHRYVRLFTPHLVTRQVYTGNGRVGLGQESEHAGFQLSQRADFFEKEVGLETTLRRPVMNTRDEPHADARRFRRLHVITGDANRSEFATWLKLGTTQLVLRAIADGAIDDSIELADPVAGMHTVSHDLDLDVPLPLADGRRFTAVQIQRELWKACSRYAEFGDATAEDHDILDAWATVLQDLDTDPLHCADRLDWVAKYALLDRYRVRDGLAWDHPKLALIDVQYSELDPARSLHDALVRKGRMRRLTTDEDVEAAIGTPPHDTRAWFRGECVRRFGSQLVAVSWDSVMFDLPGERTYVRLPMDDPYRGSFDSVGSLFADDPDAATLVERLAKGS